MNSSALVRSAARPALHAIIRKTLWVLGVISLAGATGRGDDLDDFIRRTMVERRLSGLSIAVARNGQTLKHAAYGQVGSFRHQLLVDQV